MNKQNKTRFFAFDVEADGPCPGLYSMVSVGIVEILNLTNTFYSEMCPISDNWLPEALAVSGFTREQTLSFTSPEKEMERLIAWLNLQPGDRAILISDNPAFDWQWINYYTHKYLKKNPFGHSARRIGDVYSGMSQNLRETNGWKKWRKTKHTHNALDDARGVAEGWLGMLNEMKIKIRPKL